MRFRGDVKFLPNEFPIPVRSMVVTSLFETTEVENYETGSQYLKLHNNFLLLTRVRYRTGYSLTRMNTGKPITRAWHE